MIKFNKHNVTNGTSKARVFYSLDNRADGRKVVTIYGKTCLERLKPIFVETENNSDSMTDYIESDCVKIFENNPLYVDLRKKVESWFVKV